MHIIQAHKFYFERDGASKYMLHLSGLLQGAGHTVTPFSMHHRGALPHKADRYFVSDMDIGEPGSLSFGKKLRYGARMLYSREAKNKMRSLLEAEPVDIVHIHNIYHHISPSILPEIKKRGIPIVMTLHDYKLLGPNYTLFHHGKIHEEDTQGWYRSCIKNRCVKDNRAASAFAVAEMIFHHKIMKYYERAVDRFIAPSECMFDLCVKHGWPRHKFVHIPHPVEPAPLSTTDGSFVAYVGRLSQEKGLDILLEAAKKTPAIPYKIVGTGPLEEQLKQRVRDEHISNVSFDGFQSGAQLERTIDEARLLVVPSLWYENYPLSVLEAKARGKVVVGADIGGIPEMLPHELLVPLGNVAALAKKIELWYTTLFSKREEMGKQLASETRVVNDPKAHLDAILRLYHNLIV